MQIVSQGVDIVECARIERIWRRYDKTFLDRVYTPAEQEYCVRSKIPVIRLAGRFAAKEAVLKALGTGWRGGIEFRDIEMLPDPLGKPLVTLHRKTAELARTLGIDHILVSISHAGDYAIASAIALGKTKPDTRARPPESP
jgi:holo-[acyl-carrier protein] synthase